MTGVAFALGAAASWAFSAICVRLGLRYMPATIGTFVSLLSGLVLMLAVVLLFQRDDLSDVTLRVVAIFSLVGFFNFNLGRYLNFLSISHFGVTRSTPVLASTPLFATILAIVILGESVNVLTVAGTGLVIGGLYVVLKA